tara:strand:- start:3246 stop:3668 length:423 start_codon:yes stop_codon:yes gene_type:complete
MSTTSQRIRFRNKVRPLERQNIEGRWWADSDVGASFLKAEGTINLQSDTLEYGRLTQNKIFPVLGGNGGVLFIKCNTIDETPTDDEPTVYVTLDSGQSVGKMKLLIGEAVFLDLTAGATAAITISDPDMISVEYLKGERS